MTHGELVGSPVNELHAGESPSCDAVIVVGLHLRVGTRGGIDRIGRRPGRPPDRKGRRADVAVALIGVRCVWLLHVRGRVRFVCCGIVATATRDDRHPNEYRPSDHRSDRKPREIPHRAKIRGWFDVPKLAADRESSLAVIADANVQTHAQPASYNKSQRAFGGPSTGCSPVPSNWTISFAGKSEASAFA